MISFFGDCDKKGGNSNGKIIHANPMWTKKKNIADMKDEVDGIRQMDEDGSFIDKRARARKMARKKRLEKKLDQIKASDPVGKVEGRELDKVAAAVESFAEEVRNLNPTNYDNDEAIKKGRSTINPQMQGRFAKEPCIELKSEDELEVARACNMRIEGKKVSRDDMTRGIYMLQEILGIRPSHLGLKRDKPSGYIHKSNQVQVGDIPGDMTKAVVRNNGNGRNKKSSVEMYTCPDCKKVMKAGGKGLHKSRWCKAEKKAEKPLVPVEANGVSK